MSAAPPTPPRPGRPPDTSDRGGRTPERSRGGAAEAGARAAGNTLFRAVGSLLGRVATLALFAAMARALGQSGLGAYVTALAFVQIATMPVYFGFDRYLLRRVARDRAALEGLFADILALKLLIAVPVVAVAFTVLGLLDYDATARQAAYVLTAGLLLDSLSKTLDAVYNAFERAGILATVHVFNRVLTAALGIAVLIAGLGVVAVAITYTIGSAAAFGLTLVLLARRIGMPRRRPAWRTWRPLVRRSSPFAAQEILTVLLERIDAVILAALATQAAVGLYGAAYRLFESTFFVAWAVTGAFSAMFTYLGSDTEPTVQAVYGRAVKLLVALLTPAAVTLAVLAEPLSRLLFGPEFGAAAESLRLLAPAVVLVGVVTVSTSLVLSRRGPGPMVAATAVVVALNVGLNLAIVPELEGAGAALAMLLTEAAFVLVAVTLATRAVGRVEWARMLATPVLAGIAMVVPLVVLDAVPLLGALLGATVYLAAFVALERRLNPADLAFVIELLGRRLPSRLRRRVWSSPAAPGAEP